jgi:hypothetical protein
MWQRRNYDSVSRLARLTLRGTMVYMAYCCLDMLVYRTKLRDYLSLPQPIDDRVYIYDLERNREKLDQLLREVEESESPY